MTRTSLIAVLFVTFSSEMARADVTPPDVVACSSLSTGDPCDNGAGVCQDSTCSRFDYAHWDRDASPAPPSTSYGCKKCVPKGAGTGTGADTGTATATTTTTGPGPGVGDKQDDNDSSGCSVGGARVIAPWLLAVFFAVGVSLLRRRPRR